MSSTLSPSRVEEEIARYTALCNELRLKREHHYIDGIDSQWAYYKLEKRHDEAKKKLRHWERLKKN
jgi:hypothetical protein